MLLTLKLSRLVERCRYYPSILSIDIALSGFPDLDDAYWRIIT
jgi:hypothetical protein